MSEWKPNKDVLEDMIKDVKMKRIGGLATQGKVYTPLVMIDEIRNGTEFGRALYESFLVMHYLKSKEKYKETTKKRTLK